MVHIEEALGVETTQLMLRTLEGLSGPPVALVAFDPGDPDSSRVIRVNGDQDVSNGHTSFCTYMRERLPGGAAQCTACELRHCRRAYEERWTDARAYTCDMGLTRFATVLRVADDYSDPIIAGQALPMEGGRNRALNMIDGLPERINELGAAAPDADWAMHRERLSMLIEDVPVLSDDQIKAKCTNLTEALRGWGQLVQLKHDVGLVFHSLKGPLHQALGGAERLRRHMDAHGGAGDPTPDILDRIAQGLDAVRARIRAHEAGQYLLGRQTMPLPRAMHPINALLRKGAQEFTTAARVRGIEITVSGAPTNLLVSMNWDFATDAFRAIIENAVQSSWAKRRVEIRFALETSAAEDVPNLGSRHLRVSIADYGLQILPEDKARIFMAGSRGQLHDREHMTQGAGIGLYLAKRVVDYHGWRLDVWCSLFDNAELEARAREYMGGKAGQCPAGQTVFTVAIPERDVESEGKQQ